MVQCMAEIPDEMHNLARKIVDDFDTWKGELAGVPDIEYWGRQEERAVKLAELVLLWECVKDKGNAPQDGQDNPHQPAGPLAGPGLPKL